MRVWILTKIHPEIVEDNVFTHYWNNQGENYWDTTLQLNNQFIWDNETGKRITVEGEWDELGYESPLDFYLSKNFKSYGWKELDATRFTRRTINELRLQMDASEIAKYGTLFFKVEDGEWDETDPENPKWIRNDIPLYYYSSSPTEVSDQNYERVSYTIECELDKWATYWCYMHSIMKKCPEKVHFLQKMCDRFKFTENGNIGFWIDYLTQPYLMRTNQYSTPLYVNYTQENFLSLEDWLYINSKDKEILSKQQWLTSIWLPWYQNQWMGYFKGGNKGSESSDLSIAQKLDLEDADKTFNASAKKLPNQFLDDLYNANSKYRYLVLKPGNNTWPTGEDSDNEKKLLFGNDTIKVINPILDEYQLKTQEVSLTEEQISNKFYTNKNNSFSYDILLGQFTKESEFENVNVLPYFESFVLKQKAIPLIFKYWLEKDGKGNPIYLLTTKLIWFDGLDEEIVSKYIESPTPGINYIFKELSSKSYTYDIKADSISTKVYLGIKFEDTENIRKVYLTVNVSFNANFDLDSEYTPNIDIFFDNIYSKDIYITPITVNPLTLATKFRITTERGGTELSTSDLKITGSELVIIPFKKGEAESKYIQAFNSTNYDVTMGNASIMGMPVNDIPPSVLALALRTWNNKNQTQTFGDAISSRDVEATNYAKCPLDVVDIELGYSDENTVDIPSIWTSFDYIPVCVATSPNRENIYDVIGGNDFFNYLYDLLTNDFLTSNTYYMEMGERYHKLFNGGNTPETDPIFYSPGLWKWCYYIDGLRKIELTADMIDFKKLVTLSNWNIYLNTNFTSSTNYYLDITTIKNKLYPMTKVGMELISGDQSSYPFTTEAYNNWLQQNQLTQETSKNAKDISNTWRMNNAMLGSAIDVIASPILGAGQGFASSGTWQGAVIGAAAGQTNSISNAIGKAIWLPRTFQEINEQWENRWRGTLSNMYSAPSSLNSSGFNTGSLVYSPFANSVQNSYELFKTYRIPKNIEEEIWHDISMNGYKFASQCNYNDYNNRINYNVVNCNLTEKEYVIINYLKEAMEKISPLFSQIDVIMSFVEKCTSVVRLFKCLYDKSYIDDIVSENIEKQRELYIPFTPSAKHVIWTGEILPKHDTDYEYIPWYEPTYNWWEDIYQIISDNPDTIEKKTNTSFGDTEDVIIPYSYFGYGIVDEASFKERFEGLCISNENSYISTEYEEGLYVYPLYKHSNTSLYSNEGIIFNSEITGEEVSGTFINIEDSKIMPQVLGAINIQKQDVIKAKTYTNGWDITCKFLPEGIKISGESFSNILFDNNISGYTLTDSDTFEWEDREIVRFNDLLSMPENPKSLSHERCASEYPLIMDLMYTNIPAPHFWTDRYGFTQWGIDSFYCKWWNSDSEAKYYYWDNIDIPGGSVFIKNTSGPYDWVRAVIEKRDHWGKPWTETIRFADTYTQTGDKVEKALGNPISDFYINKGFGNKVTIKYSDNINIRICKQGNNSRTDAWIFGDWWESSGTNCSIDQHTATVSINNPQDRAKGSIIELFFDNVSFHETGALNYWIDGVYVYHYYLRKDVWNAETQTYDWQLYVQQVLIGAGHEGQWPVPSEIPCVGIEMHSRNTNLTISRNISIGGSANWKMDNNLNSLIFVAKDPKQPNKSIILKNKKRG